MKRVRCAWPGCALRIGDTAPLDDRFCTAHWTALGPQLQSRFRKAIGTEDWLPMLDACQAHARETIAWRQAKVTGG